MRYPELVFSAPKKSGKTGFAAMIALYVVRALGGPYAEGICVANDFEQAQGRVFTAVTRIVRASPMLAGDASITADEIEFRSTGATIIAISSDFASAAGSNPTVVVFDELWGFASERANRLFDELVPPPTRRIACRLVVTYAGYTGESTLLEGLHKRGLKGNLVEPDLYAQPGLLMFWTHDFTAPWQTDGWREEMRAALRPNAYLRLIENRWVTTEESFLPIEWWDRCVAPDARPLLADRRLPVWAGVDASVKRDSTAIACCTYDRGTKKVSLVYHRIFQPSQAEPLNFETTIEETIIDLSDRFKLVEVRYDPYQMAATAQRLLALRVPMVEFPQTQGNLTEASQNLYELVKSANLSVYQDDAIRLSVQRAVAVEMPRGWKISKAAASHKIDVVIALAQAALGAVQDASRPAPVFVSDEVLNRLRGLAAMNAGLI